MGQLSRLQGQDALEFTHRTIAEILQTEFDRLPQALRETGAEALVLDGVQVELGLVPMHLDMPYVHVSNSLHYDFSGHTPLFAFDWPYENRRIRVIERADSFSINFTDQRSVAEPGVSR